MIWGDVGSSVSRDGWMDGWVGRWVGGWRFTQQSHDAYIALGGYGSNHS